MTIKLKSGGLIEFFVNIDNFGYFILYRVDGTEYKIDLTEEEAKWLLLDMERKVQK